MSRGERFRLRFSSTVLENSNINVNEIEHTYFRLPNVHESTNTEKYIGNFSNTLKIPVSIIIFSFWLFP